LLLLLFCTIYIILDYSIIIIIIILINIISINGYFWKVSWVGFTHFQPGSWWANPCELGWLTL